VEGSGLTAISFECHPVVSSDPNDEGGLSCMASYAEGHLGVHTWPESGAVLLDLYAASAVEVAPLYRSVNDAFGVEEPEDPRVGAGPNVLWGFARRGGGTDVTSDLDDINMYSEYLMKRQVAAMTTKLGKKLEIWEWIGTEDTPGIKDVRKHGLKAGDKRLKTAELCSPELGVWVDEVVQAPSESEHECHEALVQSPSSAADRAPRSARS